MLGKLRESSTFKLVAITWGVITWAFIKSQYSEAPMGIIDYAQATGVTLAIWLGREWRSAHYPKKEE